MQPLQEEASIIKLWLARVANHLEHAETHGEHASVSDLPELFGPCSPVKHDSPLSIIASLIGACTVVDSLVCQDTSANIAVSILGEMPTRIYGTEIHRETDLTTNEVVVGAFEADSRQMMSTEQTIEVPSETSALLQVVTYVEDLVVVEDASGDEEATLVVQSTFEDPIFLTTIEDGLSHSMVEGNTKLVLMEDAPNDEEATLVVHGPSLSMVENNTKPRLVEDLPIATMSSSSTRARVDEDLACPPLAPSLPSTTKVRCRFKSYNNSSLRRSARLAQRGAFKDLGIVGIDGKPNESSIQACADHLKELLPPDLLKKLLSFKGHAFWNFAAEVYLPFH